MGQMQEQKASEKDASIYFRLNFFILEAIYIKLIEHINREYANASLKKDAEGMDLFYKKIMKSNRTDYSKYKNGSCQKDRITSTMERKLLIECPWLRKPLKGEELLKIGNITEKWARENLEKEEPAAPADIKQFCLEQVDLLTKNVVHICRKSLNEDGQDTPNKICIWMCRYIVDNWVESFNSEAKVEAKLRELETITIEDIDKCSKEKLSKYYETIKTMYERFETIYEYKNMTNK